VSSTTPGPVRGDHRWWTPTASRFSPDLPGKGSSCQWQPVQLNWDGSAHWRCISRPVLNSQSTGCLQGRVSGHTFLKRRLPPLAHATTICSASCARVYDRARSSSALRSAARTFAFGWVNHVLLKREGPPAGAFVQGSRRRLQPHGPALARELEGGVIAASAGNRCPGGGAGRRQTGLPAVMRDAAPPRRLKVRARTARGRGGSAMADTYA